MGALLNARVGVDVGLSDLRWVSYFKMHKRAAVAPERWAALSAGRRRSSVQSARRGRAQRGVYGRGRHRLETRPCSARRGETIAARQLRDRTGTRRATTCWRYRTKSTAWWWILLRCAIAAARRRCRRGIQRRSLRQCADGRCSMFPTREARSSVRLAWSSKNHHRGTASRPATACAVRATI